MRKRMLCTAFVLLFLLLVLPIAQAATELSPLLVPAIDDIEVFETDIIVVQFASPQTVDDIFGVSFRVDDYGSVSKMELADDGLSLSLRLSRRLNPGQEYALLVENWMQGGAADIYGFVAVETVRPGEMQGKIASRNTAVQMTQNAIAMVEAGQEALLEGRQTLFDVYSELDRAIGEFPALELPFPEPEGEFEERMNELVTEAHRQARSALVSNRDALIDQILSLEYQREDLATNLKKARLQSDMAVRQLTLAVEAYAFAYHSMSAQLVSLEESVTLISRQLAIADIQVSLGLITVQEAQRVAQTAKELNRAVAMLEVQQSGIVAEINLLLGQAHDTPLRIAEPMYDFSTMDEEVDYARDLQRIRGSNLTLQSLATDVVLKARAVDRIAGSSPERRIAEYELANARIRYSEEERKLALGFRRLVDDISAKESALSLSNEKYALQKRLFGHAELRYELGMLSAIGLESERHELYSASRLVQEAERDLFMTLTRYRFMLDGLTL